MTGGCTCGRVRYRMGCAPLFTHCCHCRWCQRETGSAFVLNALIETAFIEVTAGRAEPVMTPTASGSGQEIHRCPDCRVALWSHYSGAGPRFAFLRAGTLDNPDACPPDIHIFTESKQPWVILPEGDPAMPQYYNRDEYWPQRSLDRRAAVLQRN